MCVITLFMVAGVSELNRALNHIPKRAEQRQADRLRDTFVDSGVAAALEVIDHQVLYGRRGTGKTHALRYLETTLRGRGDIAAYLDLRTIGSPNGLFIGDAEPPTERAAKLLIDLLGQLHESLLAAVIEDDTLIRDTALVSRLDALTESITTIRLKGEVEVFRQDETHDGDADGVHAGVSLSTRPQLAVSASTEKRHDSKETVREVRRGREQVTLNFSDVARVLRDIANGLTSRRVWVLLDEWSSVPTDVQPYLAEFLVRCVLPLPMFSVKIAAIEQQTNFRQTLATGATIGIELGADVAANVNLDEFMVFEQNEDQARSFFRGLLFKHLTRGTDESDRFDALKTESDLIRLGFTDKRAFDELVRAAEGVPRDAINIAAKAALLAGNDRIAVNNVRAAARSWYQTDKEAAVRSREEASRLLNWIIDKVIRQKRARGFLVNQKSSGAPLLLALFDARVLHLVRRGYSAQDEPGERYDVWVIDYGAYVDLIHTKNEPQGVLPYGEAKTEGYIEVPTQDLRAIRRAILDLDDFAAMVPR